MREPSRHRGPLNQAIRHVRRRLRWALIVERSLLTAAAFTLAGLLLILLDWILVFPSLFRTVDFTIGVCALLAVVHWWIVPATQFTPRLVDVALRIERVLPALRTRLAAALEYEIEGATSPLAKEIEASVAASTREVRRVPIVNPAPVRRAAMQAAAVGAVVALLWAGIPGWTSIATKRLLQPWSATRWPAATEVESLVDATHAARGMPLRLRARLVRGDPVSTEVAVSWTLVDGESGRRVTHEAIMPRQPDGDFEYLLEPGMATRVEWVFRTDDSESPEQVVRFIDPPAVRSVVVRVDPPSYAAGIMEPTILESAIQPGADPTLVAAGAVLEGSAVTVTLELDPAPPCPPAGADEKAMDEWASRQWRFGGGAAEAGADAVGVCDGATWTLRWTATGSDSVEATPTDQRGLSSPSPVRVFLEAMPDARPTVTLRRPEQDERVVADARVDIQAELSDDIALAWGAVEAERLRVGEGQTQVHSDRAPVGGRQVPFGRTLNLRELGGGCVAGDQIEVKVLAQDVAGEALGREPVSSIVRRLRVVSRAQFEQDAAAAAQAIRSQAMRAEGRQEEVQRASAADRRAIAQQVEVGDRVEAAHAAAEALLDRLERNGLGDQPLAQAMREAGSQLREAGEQAGEAREAMQRAGAAAEEEDAAAEEAAAREARDAQREVRDALTAAARILERDEDSWSLRRDAERVRERLDAAREARRSMSSASAGAKRDELGAGDRQALDRAAAESEQAASQARDLLDELRRRAEAMQDGQPDRAEAMRRAAETAERAGLTESIDRSAAATKENQQAEAEQGDASARQALAGMEEALDQEEQLRLESLKRKLASLVQSIEGLIAANEVMQAEATGSREAAAVAGDVVALHRNTDAVQDEAGALGPDGAGMVRSLARAAEHQAAAAVELRASEADRAAAGEALGRAKPMLQDALAAAKAREEQADRQQQQQEQEALKGKYLAILPLQDDVVKGMAAVLEERASGRRLLIEARRLATLQAKVDEQMSAVSKEQAIQASTAFAEAHRLAHEAALAAGGTLARGVVDDQSLASAEMVREVVASLVEALSQEATRRDRFGRDQLAGAGSGGGGGGGPGEGELPPAVELKVLKSLQGQIQRRTRSIAEGASARPGEMADLSARQRAVATLVSELAEKLEKSKEEDGGTAGLEGAGGVGGRKGGGTGTREENPRGFPLPPERRDGD